MQCPLAEIGTEGVKSDSAVEGVPELKDGYIRPFDKPGLGVKWRDNSNSPQ
jgi:L-alanine-DL-glutamate epimerase-like enolase superfamily enzyme